MEKLTHIIKIEHNEFIDIVKHHKRNGISPIALNVGDKLIKMDSKTKGKVAVIVTDVIDDYLYNFRIDWIMSPLNKIYTNSYDMPLYMLPNMDNSSIHKTIQPYRIFPKWYISFQKLSE
ncbi:MAG: hypothetical protein Q4P17_07615 [Methanobacterium sp.]|nr:hypothetical protein [Methanobacterium sp.]